MSRQTVFIQFSYCESMKIEQGRAMLQIENSSILGASVHCAAPGALLASGMSLACQYFLAGSLAAHDFDCASECKNQSPLCLILDDELTGIDVGGAFGELFERLQEPKPLTIEKEYLQGLFDVAEDPCERSDTTFTNSNMTNKGNACSVTTRISEEGAEELGAELVVPELLSADVAFASDEIIFTLGDVRPNLFLVIYDEDLQADWGGHVSKINFQDEQSVFWTDAGCIVYRY